MMVTGFQRESCAEMKPDGQWNNVRCTGETRGYICEKLKDPLVESTVTPVATTLPTTDPVTTTPSVLTTAPAVSSGETPPTPAVSSDATHPSEASTMPLPESITHQNLDEPGAAKSEPSGSLSGGGIAGIVITIVVVLPALAVAAFFIRKRRLRRALGTGVISYSNNSYDDRAPVIRTGDLESYT